MEILLCCEPRSLLYLTQTFCTRRFVFFSSSTASDRCADSPVLAERSPADGLAVWKTTARRATRPAVVPTRFSITLPVARYKQRSHRAILACFVCTIWARMRNPKFEPCVMSDGFGASSRNILEKACCKQVNFV
jgi:hypothetical protein